MCLSNVFHAFLDQGAAQRGRGSLASVDQRLRIFNLLLTGRQSSWVAHGDFPGGLSIACALAGLGLGLPRAHAHEGQVRRPAEGGGRGEGRMHAVRTPRP